MLNKSEHDKYKKDFIMKTLVQEEQFIQWLKKFLFLNSALKNEYDAIYQDSFYIVFYELSTVGLAYSKKILRHLEKGDNHKKAAWYKELTVAIENLKNIFSSIEFEYIKYKRHNASHIFQDGYEHQVFEQGEIKSQEREDKVEKMSSDFRKLILKHRGDKGFDIYMHRLLYSAVIDLNNRLKVIQDSNPDN
jgi:hypothetical protein